MRILTIIGVCMLMLSCSTNDGKVELFNGTDLSNWEKVLFEPGEPDEVFRAEDGVIKVAGLPFGYIITKESYANFKLHVEWRWTAEPSNSGVLLHVQEKNTKEWPLCIEAQLHNGDAGDLVLIGLGSGITVADTVRLIEAGERRYEVFKGMEESSEKAAGEWNSYDIICSGSAVELKVNGVLQNVGSGATFSGGRIALQAEGSEIEFRNVYLYPIGK